MLNRFVNIRLCAFVQHYFSGLNYFNAKLFTLDSIYKFMSLDINALQTCFPIFEKVTHFFKESLIQWKNIFIKFEVGWQILSRKVVLWFILWSWPPELAFSLKIMWFLVRIFVKEEDPREYKPVFISSREDCQCEVYLLLEWHKEVIN